MNKTAKSTVATYDKFSLWGSFLRKAKKDSQIKKLLQQYAHSTTSKISKALSYKTYQGLNIIGQCKIKGGRIYEGQEIYPYAGSLK